ncbi:MAG: CSLREA domain-containing protein, partial [Chloroflexota bacterium]
MMKSPAVIYAYENLKGAKKFQDPLTSQNRRSEVAKDRSNFQLIFLMAILLILAGAVFVLTAAAAGTTFTVNTTDDAGDDNPGDGLCSTASGECSLRAAIEELNALGADADPHQIHFDIPGAGPHVISPTEELPRINVPVVIDGSTQPGASCPTADQQADLQIVLD